MDRVSFRLKDGNYRWVRILEKLRISNVLLRPLGCADKLIRIFDLHGKLGKTISGSADVVRALCRVTKGHLSGADFASAGNDGMIRLWSLQGKQLGQLQGHDSFIYSLVSLSTGELASSGEDRTVRIWRGNDCVQTITHPAISVWTIGACAENGDLVSGASDRVVRVFTRDNKRQAEPSAIAAFEDSVKSSSIPQQQVGSINREKLPGPEFLQQRSGTKEGQVQMIQESNGSVSAHQWSQASQSWTNVGTVVDAAGSSGRKTTYGGKDYDYVFDVDIEDGKPALKLPYNLSQNPYEAATKFIQDNELPMSYLDEVANFITKNTQGASLGGQAQGGSDPWGSDARYRPDETQQPSISTPSSGARPKKIPQTTYLSMKNANFGNILKKVTDLNQQLVDEGSADVALSNELLMTLKSTSKPLEDFLSEKSDTCPDLTEPLSVVLHMISTWPDSSRLPALDLLRLFTAASSVVAEYHPPGSNATIVQFLATNAFQDKDRVNNLMLAVRTFSNLFETELGLSLADKEFEQIHSLVKATMESPGYSTNENLAIAITTVDLNYAVLFTSSVAYKALPSSLDRALELLDELVAIINQAGYSEAVYRALVATRILLSLGEEVEEAARQIYDLESALKKAESKYEETRILGAILEIRGLLKS